MYWPSAGYFLGLEIPYWGNFRVFVIFLFVYYNSIVEKLTHFTLIYVLATFFEKSPEISIFWPIQWGVGTDKHCTMTEEETKLCFTNSFCKLVSFFDKNKKVCIQSQQQGSQILHQAAYGKYKYHFYGSEIILYLIVWSFQGCQFKRDMRKELISASLLTCREISQKTFLELYISSLSIKFFWLNFSLDF